MVHPQQAGGLQARSTQSHGVDSSREREGDDLPSARSTPLGRKEANNEGPTSCAANFERVKDSPVSMPRFAPAMPIPPKSAVHVPPAFRARKVPNPSPPGGAPLGAPPRGLQYGKVPHTGTFWIPRVQNGRWVRGSPKAWREPRRRLNLHNDASGWEAHLRHGGGYGQQRVARGGTAADAQQAAAANNARQPKLGWGVKGPDTAEKARYRAKAKKAKPSARPAGGPNVVTRAAAAKAANAEAKKTAKAPVAPAAAAAAFRVDAADPLAC